MADAVSIEERLTMLEKEVARLKLQVEQLPKPNGNWLERISGSMKDIPEDVWKEFQESCAEVRQDDRPKDNRP